MNATVPVAILWRLLPLAKRKDLLSQSGASYVEYNNNEPVRTKWSKLDPCYQRAVLDVLKQLQDNLARHRT